MVVKVVIVVVGGGSGMCEGGKGGILVVKMLSGVFIYTTFPFFTYFGVVHTTIK